MMNEPTRVTDRLLAPDEVAAALRLPVRSVRYLIRRGELPAIVLPAGQMRVEQSALTQFIARCRQ